MASSRWNANEVEVNDTYSDTLSDLTFNSRPHIMTLTELAFDYSKSCPQVIVHVIEKRIQKAEDTVKLPTLYLLDSIIKNHGDPYRPLFSKNLTSTFTTVFTKSNEKIRAALFKLRNTWTPIFPAAKLYQLDMAVKKLDPAWPISAKPPAKANIHIKPPGSGSGSANIHINPAVFGRQQSQSPPETDKEGEEMKRMEKELKELKRKKLELELENARKEFAQVKEQVSAIGSSAVLEPPAKKAKKSESPSKTSHNQQVCPHLISMVQIGA